MRLVAPFALFSLALAVTPAVALVVGKVAPAPFEALYERVDVDRNGQITRAEFDAARSAGFARADTDRNGRLVQAELSALAQDSDGPADARRLREQQERLRSIDRNGDLAVDAAEFAALGENSFNSLDVDRGGGITRSEAGALARAMGF